MRRTHWARIVRLRVAGSVVGKLLPSILLVAFVAAVGCSDKHERALEAIFFESENPPCQPVSPTPADGATDQPLDLTLVWSCYNGLETGSRVYVRLGTANPPPFHSLDLGDVAFSYDVAGLERGVRYYWQVVVEDPYGVMAESPVWSFVTTGNQPVTVPTLPSPANGEVIRDLQPYFEWDAADPESGSVTYRIAWYEDSSSITRFEFTSTNIHHQYNAGRLAFGTTYYWQVEAEDNAGNITLGPLWSFSLPYMGKIAWVRDPDIYISDADGSNPTQLTDINDGYAGYPDWSPDFTKIAYNAYIDSPNDSMSIWVMNANGSGKARLTQHAGRDHAPSWSPDGTRITFQRQAPGEVTTDIWIMNADGSGQVNLTSDSTLYQTNPDWSPDGTKILFDAQAPASSIRHIWTMNTDGSGLVNVTGTGNYHNSFASWSPNGQQIAFASYRSYTYQIVSVNADGSGEIVLTTGSDDSHAPTWSPDGSMIAFCSGSYYDIYLMNTDGTDRTRVITNTSSSAKVLKFPAWGMPPQ